MGEFTKNTGQAAFGAATGCVNGDLRCAKLTAAVGIFALLSLRVKNFCHFPNVC